MENGRTARQDLGHPVPALDHRHVLQQGRCSGQPAWIPESPPATWDELVDAGQEAHQGRTVRSGADDPLHRLSLLDVRRAGHAERPGADERRRQRDLLRRTGDGVEALQFWKRPRRQARRHARGHHRVGHAAPELPRGQDRHHVALHRQPDGGEEEREAFDFGVAMLPANERRGTPTGGGNFYIFKKTTPGGAQGGDEAHPLHDQPRAQPPNGR